MSDEPNWRNYCAILLGVSPQMATDQLREAFVLTMKKRIDNQPISQLCYRCGKEVSEKWGNRPLDIKQ